MKKFLTTLFAILLSGILLFAFVGCADSISYITNIEFYSNMQRQADKIDVDFDNGTQEGFKFFITSKEEIDEIMDIIFSDTLLKYPEDTLPPGFNTNITIHQGEKSYSLNVSFITVNGKLYSFSSNGLKDKITELAAAAGAFERLE